MPNHRVDLHSPKTGIPVLWWRSVGHTHTAFVMESLIDELAHAAGKDPLEYRRALLKEHPRHLGVLEPGGREGRLGHAAAARAAPAASRCTSRSAASSPRSPKSRSRTSAIRVHRVVCAIDCGMAVNPDGVRGPDGVGHRLRPRRRAARRATFKDGRVQQSNFHDYRVLRLNEMPVVEVHIVPSTEKMGGVGEPGVPPIAPAVANAVFALTGQRLRELPLRLSTA